MKKRIFHTLFAIMMVTILSIGVASADICWQIDVFNEIIKVSSIKSATGHKVLFGTWKYVAGESFAVSGAIEKDLNDSTRLVVSLTGSNSIGAILFRASVDKLTKNGSWTLTNASVEPSFINTGTLTKVPCSTPYPASPLGAESAPNSATPR
jgi:hypothetical protein